MDTNTMDPVNKGDSMMNDHHDDYEDIILSELNDSEQNRAVKLIGRLVYVKSFCHNV